MVRGSSRFIKELRSEERSMKYSSSGARGSIENRRVGRDPPTVARANLEFSERIVIYGSVARSI